MHSIQEDMEELRRQLAKGSIPRAYRALLSYMMGLRTHFVNKYGNRAVSDLYQGRMDFTFFAIFPPSLKRRDLKVAIVFNYNAFRFEAWHAARNHTAHLQSDPHNENLSRYFRDNLSPHFQSPLFPVLHS